MTQLLTINRGQKQGSEKPKALGFRPDIQGLRALAVLAVIADHMLAYPAGGFVGVDVFFVISGFIITSMLLREYKKSGRISFADFYRRRARRILPLSVLVLGVTMLVAWYLFPGSRRGGVIEDGIWSFFFAANWHFAAAGTDYLQATGPVSPLQHFWSLAVEEQFYVVWPWLIVLVLGLLAGRMGWSNGRALKILGLAMLTITLSTFAFAMWETANVPTVAYFSTISRAWELGLGALIAIGTGTLARIPAAVRPVLAYAGLVGIFWSIFAITPDMPFPGPWAAVPVLSTALVIAAGTGGDHRFMAPLTNPVSRYVGDISFSLYLWHFPFIIFMEAVVRDQGPVYYVLLLAAIVAWSIGSYHFVEDPIRHSAWLEPQNSKVRRNRKPELISERVKIAGVGGLAAATALVVSFAFIQFQPDTVSAAVPVPVIPTPGTSQAAPQDAISGELALSLTATAWPAGLSPALDTLDGDQFAKLDSQGCAPATPRGKDCTIPEGDMSKTAVVVGDSMAVAWLPAIRKALEPKGWRVISMTYIGCPFIDAETAGSDATIVASCPGHKELAATSIQAAHPGLVIMSNNYGVDFASKPSDLFGQWHQALVSAQKNWLSTAGKVVILSAPPRGTDPKECVTAISTPADCIAQIPERWAQYADTDEKAAKQVGSHFIGTREWFCDASNNCPAFVGTTTVRRDATHITAEYAEKVAPLLDEKLTAALG